MVAWSTVLIGAWIAIAPVLAASPATPKWVLKADYVDACICALACPCLFGGPPTHGYCKGATLVGIKEGDCGHVDLAGVTILAVYNVRQRIKFFRRCCIDPREREGKFQVFGDQRVHAKDRRFERRDRGKTDGTRYDGASPIARADEALWTAPPGANLRMDTFNFLEGEADGTGCRSRKA